MAHEWSFQDKMQHHIAIEIAKGVPDYGAYGDLFKASPLEIATRILSIPEIAAALEAVRHWSEGVELPRELIEKMARVYGIKPVMIRITDD